MAHLEIDHRPGHPAAEIAAERERQIGRTKNMLVATIVGSMMILCVAALFMTMF